MSLTPDMMPWWELRAELEQAEKDNTTLRAENEKLRALLKKALNDGDGVAYDGDEDNVGYRVCCGESSYKPHDKDCWVTEIRAALEEKQ